jgi:hypothetical protein
MRHVSQEAGKYTSSISNTTIHALIIAECTPKDRDSKLGIYSSGNTPVEEAKIGRMAQHSRPDRWTI